MTTLSSVDWNSSWPSSPQPKRKPAARSSDKVDVPELITKKWALAEVNPFAEEFAKILNKPVLVAQILLNRDINIQNAGNFLSPSLAHLIDPHQLDGLDKAAKRINKAIKNKERITVFGDYDVDGCTSSSILYKALTFLGNKPIVYIPHRTDEGYGLAPKQVEELSKNCDLLITVDCGITAIDSALMAKKLKLDLIITDHHEGLDELPDCYAIVHPGYGNYENKFLCGAGVAFKTAWAIGREFYGNDKNPPEYSNLLKELLALAALGTVADVMPLKGENRAIVTGGLAKLTDSVFPGLQALLNVAGLTDKKISSYDVGFKIAPWLNAAGRMNHAREAFNILVSDNYDAAIKIANELEKNNRERQKVQTSVVTQAVKIAEEQENDLIQIIVGKDWHPGVIGIAAGKIADKFCRPTIALSIEDGLLHGSARSIEGFNIKSALDSVSSLLEKYGGHAAAAGLSLKEENLDEFRDKIKEYAEKNLSKEQCIPTIKLDCELKLDNLSLEMAGTIASLAPYGNGNRCPMFGVFGAKVVDVRVMGKDSQHLCLLVSQERMNAKVLAFGWGNYQSYFKVGTLVDLAVEVVINEYNGDTSVELFAKDIRLTRVGSVDIFA